MLKEDYHKFFDAVYNVLLDQKYLNGINGQEIRDEPEIDFEKLETEDLNESYSRFTIR